MPHCQRASSKTTQTSVSVFDRSRKRGHLSLLQAPTAVNQRAN